MPTSSSPPPSPHRIGILMSAVGRFLVCRDCQLSYTFPDEETFDAIAKQFESHLCLSPNCSSPGTKPPIGWQTDRRFVIVRYEGKVSAMASCAKKEGIGANEDVRSMNASEAKKAREDCKVRVEWFQNFDPKSYRHISQLKMRIAALETRLRALGSDEKTCGPKSH
jgi:hypothetical protein